jgi:cell division transport system permease protein
VVKLVGGTDAYVRRPLLYTGLWYGVGGGIIAAIILALGFWWLSGSVEQLADLYQSSFRLQGLGLMESLQLILLAGLTGLLGAWIAVARHLYLIQPR